MQMDRRCNARDSLTAMAEMDRQCVIHITERLSFARQAQVSHLIRTAHTAEAGRKAAGLVYGRELRLHYRALSDQGKCLMCSASCWTPDLAPWISLCPRIFSWADLEVPNVCKVGHNIGGRP